ncbi:predicted protein [Plenodomus lingam JN3]|uniref:Uncharacterized protein n=2 Tax=Leptosphaeria maculans TaxID=5022 RepID=E5A6K9_LEPMJ|nr:predicted protein [Plenodomus lingam JN3]CBX99254.1 predicted protein [Plenodomus lingam JN3]
MKQGDILAQWIPLCQTLFPYDELVPSPYIGDNSPLNQELVDRYRIVHSNQAHPLPSFLDQAIQGLNDDWMSSDQQHILPPPRQSTTAINHLLSDLVGPYVAGYGTESGHAAHFAADNNDLHMRLTNGLGWQYYLDDVSRFVNDDLFLEKQFNTSPARDVSHPMPFTPIANSNQPNNLQVDTNHLTLASFQEPFVETALSVEQPDAFSDTAFDTVSQCDGYQQLRASSHHGASQSNYGMPLYSAPVSFEYFPPLHDQLASATTMSTQTSSQGWNPACSSYMVSSWTSPTSDIESYDCISSRSVGVPVIPRLRHAQPSSRSLAEGPLTAPHDNNPANTTSWPAQQPFFAPQVVPEANQQNEAASRMPFWSA